MATIRKVKSRAKKNPGKDRYQAIIERKDVYLVKTFNTKAEAQTWARIKEADVETGKIHSKAASKAGDELIGELFERYIDEKASKKKSYAKSEYYIIKRLKEAFGGMTYSELTSQDIVDYGVERLEDVVSESLERELHPMSHMLEYAWTIWGLPERVNPVRHGVKRMRMAGLLTPGVKRERRPSDAELDALYKDLVLRNPKLLDVILFGIETGMRRGEICKLRWKHIDTDSGMLNLPKDITKNGKARSIGMTLKASLILAAVDKPRGSNKESRVFGYSDPNAVSKAFRRACERCKIEDLRPHDLRHEAISRWVEGGLSLAEARAASGHSSLAAFERYAHPASEVVRDKMLDAEKKRSAKKARANLTVVK